MFHHTYILLVTYSVMLSSYCSRASKHEAKEGLNCLFSSFFPIAFEYQVNRDDFMIFGIARVAYRSIG